MFEGDFSIGDESLTILSYLSSFFIKPGSLVPFAIPLRRNFVLLEIYLISESMFVPTFEDTSCTSIPFSIANV